MSEQSVEYAALQRNTEATMAVAGTRSYPVPAEYVNNRQLSRAAEQVLNEQAPAAVLPDKASDVEGWVTKVAAERVQWRENRAVAAELLASTTREAMRVAVGAAPAYTLRVVEDFEPLLEDFRRLLDIAPREVGGHTSPEDFNRYGELMRAVDALTVTAMDRGRLALLTDEGEDLGTDSVWLVLDPRGIASIQQVHAVLAEFRSRLPTTLEEWERFERLGLRMAALGEVPARRARFNAAVVGNSKSADMGMLDRSIDEASALGQKRQ